MIIEQVFDMPFKNPNEINYVYGKKHWTDVIKNTGPENFFIWKQPEEDFNTKSTLIVNPGEKAVFIKDGVIVEVFDNGKYKLSTENYPFISRLVNMFSGGISTFNCVVYFVKTSTNTEVKWGTDSPIKVRDKKWNILVEIRARGFFKFRIDDINCFFHSFLSSRTRYNTTDEVMFYIKGELNKIIRPVLFEYLDNKENELIGLDKDLVIISSEITGNVNESIQKYGLMCDSFSLVALDVDKSKYDEIDKSQIGIIGMKKDAEAKKEIKEILGDDWEKQQSVDILKTAAENSGVSSLITAIGFNNGIEGFNKLISGGSDELDITKRLKKLKELYDNNLITEEEYNNIRKEILSSL